LKGDVVSWNVYVTRRIPEPGLVLLRDRCSVVELNEEDRVLTHKELVRQVRGRDGILCLLSDPMDKEVLQAADKAKVFANYAVGYDNIDLTEATDRGIMVTNTPGVLTEATAELAWALLMGVARRIVESDRFVREGRFSGWAPLLLLGSGLTGKTLGIIGAGQIGSAVARKSRGFEMNVLYADLSRNRELEEEVGAVRAELPTLLRESDFVSIHVPLVSETHHLIGERELASMKRTAYLINTSRGPVVDEGALVKALAEGTIAGAGLDVYEHEPSVPPELLTLDNVVLTPHTGSATRETREQMAVLAAENLLAALEGKVPPNLVNREILNR
jgi:glyoxylate reductase